MRKQRKMKGFTLVELLIVLLILGILIGLAVPRYLTALQQSKKTTFCANVRSIISAMETYRMDKGTMEYPADGNALTASIINNPAYFSQPPINPYTGEVMSPATSTANEGTFTYVIDGSGYIIKTNPECGLQ